MFWALLGPYLGLDPVEAAAPQHLAPPHLHLAVVDLIHVLHLLLILLRELLLLRAVAGRLQELQAAGGDAGDQLRQKRTSGEAEGCHGLNRDVECWAFQ